MKEAALEKYVPFRKIRKVIFWSKARQEGEEEGHRKVQQLAKCMHRTVVDTMDRSGECMQDHFST
jgi:hypothetical protein